MMYDLPKRDPDLAYLGRNLWLPLRHVPADRLTLRLSFDQWSGKDRDVLVERLIYRKTDDHLVVPRNFMDPITVSKKYKIPVVDLRPAEYPPVTVLHSIVPRDHQLKPLELLKQRDDGTLNLGCGKGKTVVALYEAARMAVPTLIVCDNGGILANWEKEINRFLVFEGGVSWIKGSKKLRRTDFALATVSTLASRAEVLPAEFLLHWGLIIFDEGHHLSAKWFSRVCDLFHGRRLALTATPRRNDGLEAIYQNHLGEVFYTDIEQELQARVVFLYVEGIDPPQAVQEDDARLKSWLAKHREFNKVITAEVKAALKANRKALVLSHRVDQLHALAKSFPKGRVIHKDVSLLERDAALMEGEPVIGTVHLAREGLNRVELDSLFICTLFSNQNDYQQSVGRILRVCKGKKQPIVIFFVPDISRCRNQASRLRSYAKAAGHIIEEHRV